jgi:hypothetical protein
MMTPEVVRCPDGHFRRAVYGLGPYIADYPEQVWLAAIVQRWCLKYAVQYIHRSTINFCVDAMQSPIISMLGVPVYGVK